MPADPAPPTLADMLAWVEEQAAKLRIHQKSAPRSARRIWKPDIAKAEAVAALLRREMEREADAKTVCKCCDRVVDSLRESAFVSEPVCRHCLMVWADGTWPASAIAAEVLRAEAAGEWPFSDRHGTGKARPAGGE